MIKHFLYHDRKLGGECFCQRKSLKIYFSQSRGKCLRKRLNICYMYLTYYKDLRDYDKILIMHTTKLSDSRMMIISYQGEEIKIVYIKFHVCI